MWQILVFTAFLGTTICVVVALTAIQRAASSVEHNGTSAATADASELRIQDYKSLLDSSDITFSQAGVARASVITSQDSIRKIFDSVSAQQVIDTEIMLSNMDYDLDELLRLELDAGA